MKRERYKAAERKVKTYSGEWYGVNSIFGNDWAIWFYLLGGREAGKSYSVMKWAVNRKMKLGDGMKWYWFRLTDEQCENLLSGNVDEFVDKDIQRCYNINITKKGKKLYLYDEKIKKTKSGEEKRSKTNLREFCTILSCSTFYNDKGKGYFDNGFDGEYLVVLDEMNRERSEKNNFDIVYNFANQLENVLRSTHKKVRVILIGNTLDEASDLLSAINFLPDGFGRYKLKRKKAVVDYIKPSPAYIKRRKEALANQLIGDSSTLTNEVEIDRSLIVSRRACVRPLRTIKFGKEKGKWFTLWNNNIIKPYNNEGKPGLAMVRYIDDIYDLQNVNAVFEKFDARIYKFTTLATFKRFQKELKIIKKK